MKYKVIGIIESRSQQSAVVEADRYEISNWGYERKLLCFYQRLEYPDQWSKEKQVARFEGYRLDVEAAG